MAETAARMTGGGWEMNEKPKKAAGNPKRAQAKRMGQNKHDYG